MSTPHDLKVYRFATAAQWKSGLLSKIRIHGLKGLGKLVPEQPLAPSARLVNCAGSTSAPAISPDGVAYWRTAPGVPQLEHKDGITYWLTAPGHLQWMDENATTAHSIETTPGIEHSPRLAIGRKWLWTFRREKECLIRYDLDSLQVEDVIHLPHGESLLDIASDGCDGVWLLLGHSETETGNRYSLRHHVASRGDIKHVALPSIIKKPCALTYLATPQRLALLSDCGEAVAFVDPQDGKAVVVSLQDESRGFRASRIDSDHRDRLLLTGAMGPSPHSKPSMVLLLDAAGGLLDRISTTGAHEITGATARGSAVLVTTTGGIQWYAAARAGDAVDAEGVFLSPCLHSPETGSLRGWLRAEISAVLPKGATLTVTVMGTDDPGVRDKVAGIGKTTTLPPRVRQQKIKEILMAGRTGPFLFVSPGDDASGRQTPSAKCASQDPSPYAIPLFDHVQRWLWLEVCLHAAPDGRLPELHELRALYPEVSLTQYVPAIFRNDMAAGAQESGSPTGFFRQLVGLLETTTQGIDQTISSLGRRIHPASAQGEWLDFVARWLDLPWDDALPAKIKRAILLHAEELLARRSTRAGLERLLTLLLPNGKFRTIDVNVDIGVATLRSDRHPGSALPALLTGLPLRAAALSRKAVLGHARLRCPNDDPTGATRFMGRLRIELIASTQERKNLEAVLPELVLAMTPAGLRTDIRWLSGSDYGFNSRLDDGITLDDPCPRHLGQDARLGQLVLAGGKHLRLPESGLSLGFQLR